MSMFLCSPYEPIFQHFSRYLWLYALNIWRCENELVFINLVNIDLQILLGKTGLVLFSAYCLGQNTQQNTLCHFYQLSPYNQVNPTIFDKLKTLPREREREKERDSFPILSYGKLVTYMQTGGHCRTNRRVQFFIKGKKPKN